MWSILDCVFVLPEWELCCPLAYLRAITRIGSNHIPLLLSSKNDRPPQPPRFRFETFWLNQRGFLEVVYDRWIVARVIPYRSLSAVDSWHFCAKRAHQLMKDWGANLGQNLREPKKAHLASIQALDFRADSSGLSPDGWLLQYELED